MTNYLGWIRSEQTTQENIQQTHNDLTALRLGNKAPDASNFSFYTAQKSYLPLSISENSDYLAFTVGYPFWNHPNLNDAANSHDASHALLKANDTFGAKLGEALSGHFLVGVITKNDSSVRIYTDKMATLPVFYGMDNDGNFVFGSDINLIRRVKTLNVSLSNQSIFNYLYFHVIPSPDTLYQGINKLGPAECLSYKNKSHKIENYWLPSFNENDSASTQALSNELKERLDKAVERCQPDATTGAFLSGGLDSSTVCGFFSQRSDGPANCFSIGFDEQGYDEIEYARIAAKHFNLNLHEYYVTPDDVFEAIPKITEAYAEPFGNSSAIPAFFCAQVAKQNGMNTLLAGDGGDELFAGNERYVKQSIFGFYDKVPGLFKKLLLEPLLVGLPLSKLTPITRKARSYIEQARIPMPERMESYNYMRRTDLSAMFDPQFLASIDTDYPIELLSRTYGKVDDDATMLNKMLYLDWKFTLSDNDLFKVNRMCEVNDVIVRYPMLDTELVEFSTRVPSAIKLKDLKLRHFYKQALGDFLPHEIINKSKHGFGLPFGEWLKKSDKLQQTVYDNLASLRGRKIFKDSFLDELLDTYRSGHAAYYGTMIWVLAMLEQWLQTHFDQH
jgi:asparagine synthase (glutamine-hydrolysing)